MQKHKYTYEICHQFDESHKKVWQNLWQQSNQRNFFNSVDFFETYCDVFKKDEIAVIFCYRSAELCAILPLVAERIFGVKVFATPGKIGNYTDKFAILIKSSNSRIINGLINKAQELGNLYLSEVSNEIIPDLALPKRKSIVRWASDSPWTTLSPDKKALQFMSARQQRSLRQRIRQRNDDLCFQFHATDLVSALDQMIEVERGSYRHHRLMAFFEDKKNVQLIYKIITRCPNCLRIAILYYRQQPVAFILGFIYEKTFLFYQSAFKESCSNWGAGKMVYYYTIEHLINSGFRKVDLARGSSALKLQFAENIERQFNLFLAENKFIYYWLILCLFAWSILKKIKDWLFMKYLQVESFIRNSLKSKVKQTTAVKI